MRLVQSRQPEINNRVHDQDTHVLRPEDIQIALSFVYCVKTYPSTRPLIADEHSTKKSHYDARNVSKRCI